MNIFFLNSPLRFFPKTTPATKYSKESEEKDTQEESLNRGV